jgi:PKHD-type hydroxylase
MLLRLQSVLDKAALERIRDALAGAKFDDGRKTAGKQAKSVKNNMQLDPAAEPGKSIGGSVAEALRKHAVFVAAAVPKTIAPVLVSRYVPGMEYGSHVDNAIMWGQTALRSDIALTVFLTDPKDYDGGELTIEDSTFGVHRVKLPAGDGFLYPANTLHRVSPVTRGHRDAAVTWIQSLVRGVEQRRILFDLERIAAGMRARTPDAPESGTLSSVYHSLLRLWAEP